MMMRVVMTMMIMTTITNDDDDDEPKKTYQRNFFDLIFRGFEINERKISTATNIGEERGRI